MKSHERKTVTVCFDDREVVLKTALIGGIMDDEMEYPMGMYAGKIELHEICVSIVHTLRAIIKINKLELGMSNADCEHLIMLCLEEALRKQEAEHRELSLDEHEILLNLAKKKS